MGRAAVQGIRGCGGDGSRARVSGSIRDPVHAPKEQIVTSTKPMNLVGGLTVVLVALAFAAGCGSSGSAPSSAGGSGKAATVGVASSNLGDILVNSAGRTLYLFEKDSGAKSDCNGACAAAWPPLVDTGKATVGSGADAAKLGTTTRSDGALQVTYQG